MAAIVTVPDDLACLLTPDRIGHVNWTRRDRAPYGRRTGELEVFVITLERVEFGRCAWARRR